MIQLKHKIILALAILCFFQSFAPLYAQSNALVITKSSNGRQIFINEKTIVRAFTKTRGVFLGDFTILNEDTIEINGTAIKLAELKKMSIVSIGKIIITGVLLAVTVAGAGLTWGLASSGDLVQFIFSLLTGAGTLIMASITLFLAVVKRVYHFDNGRASIAVGTIEFEN